MKFLSMAFVTLILNLVSHDANSQIQGTSKRYVTTGRNKGAVLTLDKDSSFTFKYLGHISKDTAAGQYQNRGDTLFFYYHFNNYDSILSTYKRKQEQPPADIILTASRVILRPHVMVKRGNRLFYIDIQRNAVITYDDGRRTNPLVMKKL
jgi:hypothetical protein